MNIYAPKKPSKINSVSITVTLMLLIIGYLAWAFVPIYWPIFQLKGIVRGACNDAYRVLENEQVIANLVEDSRRTGLHLTKDNFRMTREPYTREELAALTQEIESLDYRRKQGDYLAKRGKSCRIEYIYKNTYSLPMIQVPLELTFQDSVTGSLETITW